MADLFGRGTVGVFRPSDFVLWWREQGEEVQDEMARKVSARVFERQEEMRQSSFRGEGGSGPVFSLSPEIKNEIRMIVAREYGYYPKM